MPNDRQWSGQWAVVTGASGGIGEVFARRLAGAGANLVVVARSAEKLDRLRADLVARHPGIEVDVVPADLSGSDGVRTVVDDVSSSGRDISILINNAGSAEHGPFAEQPVERSVAMVRLNVESLVALAGHLLPPMLQAGRGAIVNVASTAGFQPIPTLAVYSATKAFVLAFSDALWDETRGTGVHVVTLCPGATDTGFFDATGKEFLTRGRQSPEQVVDTAMRALDRGAPSLVPGLTNRVSAFSARLVPPQLITRITRMAVRASGD